MLTVAFLVNTGKEPMSLKHVILFLTTTIENIISLSLLLNQFRTKMMDCKGLLTFDS